MRVRKYPFCVAGQYVGPWFVESVCAASSSVFFSDGVPSGISSSGCERCLFGLPANCSLTVDTLPKKGTRKIVLEKKKESMRSACIGQLVAELLGGGIDSRKEIDLWLLQIQGSAIKNGSKRERYEDSGSFSKLFVTNFSLIGIILR